MTFVARNIDEVLVHLSGIIEDAKARRSRLGFFAALYRQVTLEVKRGIVSGAFDDGARMDRFDTLFANRYFAALSAWERRLSPPRCWDVTFDLLSSDETIVLQHLLLGVNAHINLDLALAAVEASPRGRIRELSRDYQLINDILLSVLGKAQDALNDVSPCLRLLDDVGGRTDEWALDFSIRKARRQAWHHALLLSEAGDEQGAMIESTMDLSTAMLARLIARPAGIMRPALQVIRYKESRDIAAVIERLDRAVS